LIRTMQQDEDPYIRQCAAQSVGRLLSSLWPEAAEFAPDLEPSLNDPATRLWAGVALWNLNRDANVIPVLIAELNHPSGEYFADDWWQALKVLGESGPLAMEAVPRIQQFLENPRGWKEAAEVMTQAAREALLQIDPESVLAAAAEAEDKGGVP
jgi:hypothetical protein